MRCILKLRCILFFIIFIASAFPVTASEFYLRRARDYDVRLPIFFPYTYAAPSGADNGLVELSASVTSGEGNSWTIGITAYNLSEESVILFASPYQNMVIPHRIIENGLIRFFTGKFDDKCVSSGSLTEFGNHSLTVRGFDLPPSDHLNIRSPTAAFVGIHIDLPAKIYANVITEESCKASGIDLSPDNFEICVGYALVRNAGLKHERQSFGLAFDRYGVDENVDMQSLACIMM